LESTEGTSRSARGLGAPPALGHMKWTVLKLSFPGISMGHLLLR
jgi:hypothetical protein